MWMWRPWLVSVFALHSGGSAIAALFVQVGEGKDIIVIDNQEAGEKKKSGCC